MRSEHLYSLGIIVALLSYSLMGMQVPQGCVLPPPEGCVFPPSNLVQQESMNCATGALGIALSIQEILTQFSEIFTAFVAESSSIVRAQIIERFALLSEQLIAIDCDFKREDDALRARFSQINFEALQNNNQELQAIGDVEKNLYQNQQELVTKLAALVVLSGQVADQLCAQTNSLQKKIDSAMSDCASEFTMTFIETNQDLINHLKMTELIFFTLVADFCEQLGAVQVTIEGAAIEQTSALTHDVREYNTSIMRSLKQFENVLRAQIKTQTSSIGADLAINFNQLTSKLSALQVECSRGANLEAINIALIDQSVMHNEQVVNQALVSYFTLINQVVLRQFSRLSLALAELAAQFNLSITSFENDVRTRLLQQFSQPFITLISSGNILHTKICALEADLACEIKEEMQGARLIGAQATSKTLSKIAALEAHNQIYTAEIKGQFSCLDANLRSVVCKNISDFELEQLLFGQAITNQLSQMFNHINSVTCSKLSTFELILSEQNNAICARLINFDANLASAAVQQFSQAQTNIARNQALLCSKIGAFDAQTSADIENKLTTFEKNVALEDYSLCAQIESVECSLITTITTDFTQTFSQVAAFNASYLACAESVEDGIISLNDNLCSQVLALDASLVEFIGSESDHIQSRLDALITQINNLNLLITIANAAFGAIAAGDVAMI